MSLNPNGYKLSDKTGKLTAYGKFIKFLHFFHTKFNNCMTLRIS